MVIRTLAKGENVGTGVMRRLPGLSTLGREHVMSLSFSGQKGRMESCKYHYHLTDSPFGEIVSGTSSR